MASPSWRCATPLIIDLEPVETIDHDFAQALISATRTACERECVLAFTCPNEDPLQILREAEAIRHMWIWDSISEAALAALSD